MAMLGVKKAATRSLFEIKRAKVSIDFWVIYFLKTQGLPTKKNQYKK